VQLKSTIAVTTSLREKEKKKGGRQFRHPSNFQNGHFRYGVTIIQLKAYFAKLTCPKVSLETNGDVNASINMASLLLFALAKSDPQARPERFNRGTAADIQPTELPPCSWFEKFKLTSPSLPIRSLTRLSSREPHKSSGAIQAPTAIQVADIHRL
jgi:hypothetical protein